MYGIINALAKANIRNSITLGGCTMEKKIEIPNTANDEKYFSQMLQKMDRKRRLIDVTLSGKDEINLRYSCEYSKSAKSFVKMFSKKDKKLKNGTIRKGYESVDEIMGRAFNEEQLKGLKDVGYEMIGVIETNKFWMLFWSKA